MQPPRRVRKPPRRVRGGALEAPRRLLEDTLREGFAKASRRRHGRLHLETIRQIMTSPPLPGAACGKYRHHKYRQHTGVATTAKIAKNCFVFAAYDPT